MSRMPERVRVKNRTLLAGAIAALAVSLACLTPMLDAWWFRDDFWLIALARYTVDPIQFWVADHSASFWFRPLGMSLWWLTFTLFGPEPMPQHLMNAGLHWVVALTFGFWMLRLSRSARIGAAAMLFYAAHPIAVRTSLWLSDRFDLLATTFVFLTCALMLGDGSSVRRRCAIGLCAFLACMSKESGLLVLPLAAAHWISTALSDTQQRARLRIDVLIIAAIVAIALGWRFTVMAPRTLQLLDLALPSTLISGAWAFLKWSPVAAVGAVGLRGVAGIVASTLMSLAVVYSAVRAFWPTPRSTAFARRNFVIAGVLLLSCALLVAPIAAQNLLGNSLIHDPISARLFHLAIASGFLILIEPCMIVYAAVKNRAIWLLVAAGLTLSAAVAAVAAGREDAATWTSATNGPLRSGLAQLTQTLARVDLPERCRVVVVGSLAQEDEFQRNGDVMVKATIGVASSALVRCLVVTATPPTFALVSSDLCGTGVWASIAASHPTAPPHRFANLCYQFLVPPLVSSPRNDPLSRTVESR